MSLAFAPEFLARSGFGDRIDDLVLDRDSSTGSTQVAPCLGSTWGAGRAAEQADERCFLRLPSRTYLAFCAVSRESPLQRYKWSL